MSEIIFKDVHFLDPTFRIRRDFEGVLHLRFTDSDYKVYESSALICGFPQAHIIKKFRKGLMLCLIPVFNGKYYSKFTLYRISYVQA